MSGNPKGFPLFCSYYLLDYWTVFVQLVSNSSALCATTLFLLNFLTKKTWNLFGFSYICIVQKEKWSHLKGLTTNSK